MKETKSLVIEKLSLSYHQKNIIEKLDLTFLKGKVSVIIGPNGCGKSTLLKGISRILKKESGVIYLENTDMEQLTNRTIATKLAYLPQSASAPEDATVRDIVELGRYPYRKTFQKVSLEENKLVDDILMQTNLLELAEEKIQNLSGGQKQRVWIGMALAQKTNIILLDEPTTYLDLGHQIDILNLLKKLNQNNKLTIIMVLHDLNLAARFSDFMIGMKDGKIIRQGTPFDIMTAKVLEELFSIKATIGTDPVEKKPICLHFDNIE